LWEDRYSFEKYPGKYDMVLMDYSAGGQVREVNFSTVFIKQVQIPVQVQCAPEDRKYN